MFSARQTQHLQGLYSLLASQRHGELERLASATASDSAAYKAEVLRVVAHSRFSRGDVVAAVGAFRRALVLMPDSVPLMRELAVCHFAAGELAEASDLLERCLAADANDVESLAKAAEIKRRTGMFAEALRLGRQALVLEPLMPEAVVTCLRAARSLEDMKLVEDLARKVLEEGAAIPVWLNDVATEAYAVVPEMSVALLRRALEISPNDPVLLLHLGRVLCERQTYAESLNFLERALLVAPDAAEVHNNFGNLWMSQERYDEAVASYRRAIKLQPSLSETSFNLCGALRSLGRYDDALAAICDAIRYDPASPQNHRRLGELLSFLGRHVDAEPAFRKAWTLAEDGEKGKAAADLAMVLMASGRHQEAAGLLAGVGVLQHAEHWSVYLCCLNYLSQTTGENYLTKAIEFGDWIGSESSFSSWGNSPDPNKRLRLGFVSADFRRHAAGRLMSALLSEIDLCRYDVYLYANQPAVVDDELTSSFQSRGVCFQRITGMADGDVANRIRSDKIDVLVDVSGHTAGNRLGVFALKPAPVQIAWMGYFASTGLRQMDYVIGDPWVLPLAERSHFVEQPIVLPDSYYCYPPPVGAPEISMPPGLDSGIITFGCFNNLAKITDEVLNSWSSILTAVPAARLLMKSVFLGGAAELARLTERCAAFGIDPARVQIEGASSWYEYLAAYHRVDIALDTFPFTGGLTSLDGLWMGVPLLTLKGTRFIGHQGEMILANLGLSDWIAADVNDYVEKASRLGGMVDQLAQLRTTLRERMLRSPLCDSERFARSFEQGVRSAWVQWCQSEGNL